MQPLPEKLPIFVAPPVLRPDGSPVLGRVLIANRGEIACRVIRTCKLLFITTIAVFADEDQDSLHVQQADEAICIGPADAQPYQNIKALIEVAKSAKVDAIHPGYGYLSENASFAAAVAAAGIRFIGSSPESISQLGDKRDAKEYLSKNSSVPLIPGYAGRDQDPADLEAEAEKIGYPVLIKASAGGGGKGMRIVREKSEFKEALLRCTSEAERSFGSGHCLIEKYIESGKHIEMQVFGDGETFISLLDRECSIQRRHQKIVEESPSMWLSSSMRQEMSDCALEIARLLKYESAGTVEFIVDIEQKKFYFLEVNTRIQVEHPITEEVVGVDIVALQIFVAAGGKLASLPELKTIRQQGHAVEVRLCAENPFNDFLPCTGTMSVFELPKESETGWKHLRFETGIQSGSKISVHFDSMICKIIAWAPTRGEAVSKIIFALKQTTCLGVITNQIFLQRI
ncbi:carbamoyl-phosphate synthase L chain, ATP binding domain-containing protein, partial [Plectosphaerella cucumerina]